MPLPNQLAVGIGVVRDQQPQQNASTLVLSFAFPDSGTNYWPSRVGLVFEAEVGPTSDIALCGGDASTGDAPNCSDAAVLIGSRFHFFRKPVHHATQPFVSLLIGSYWKGSGVDDPEFL